MYKEKEKEIEISIIYRSYFESIFSKVSNPYILLRLISIIVIKRIDYIIYVFFSDGCLFVTVLYSFIYYRHPILNFKK